MLRLNNHIAPFRHFILALFFLANSGFTVVLYHCTVTVCPMGQELPAMSCCSGDHGCTCGMCEEAARPRTAGEHSVTLSRQCQTATVAGGNISEPTILNKTITGRVLANPDCPAVHSHSLATAPRFEFSVFHMSIPSNVSTSSVEKYVLNAAFLI